MNLKIVIPSVIAVVGSIAAVVSVLGSEGALMEQFPDIPPKVVAKVHRKMLRDTLTGRLDGDLTEDQLNEIFLARVHAYTA